MDIAEETIKPKKGQDLLKQIFESQAIVEKEFGKVEGIPERLLFGNAKNLHLPETCRHINDNIFWRMVQEINEAVVALRNAKTWRQTTYFTDINEYYDEIADIMIYFINACLASGIDPDPTASVATKLKFSPSFGVSSKNKGTFS